MINKVYKAFWNKAYVTSKSFNTDNVIVTKEIVREIRLNEKVPTEENILRFHGITSSGSNRCLLVIDYEEGRNFVII
ncbi:hypothetical protein RclHR1_01120015 [Rhizophagus clarus]|uniref:Uncharacterized protein n=1 Tax=Rhizophagus clarus TaxID=94130 RepID=A0A2Z6Q3W8_9GLOM|nr:hypothetical protein RclHR1_01120015 [Rhizophagus clarus]